MQIMRTVIDQWKLTHIIMILIDNMVRRPPRGRGVEVLVAPALGGAGRRCVCAGSPSRANLTVCGAFLAGVDIAVCMRVLCVCVCVMHKYVTVCMFILWSYY